MGIWWGGQTAPGEAKGRLDRRCSARAEGGRGKRQRCGGTGAELSPWASLWFEESVLPWPDIYTWYLQYQVLHAGLLSLTLPELSKPVYKPSPHENIQLCI